LAAATRYTVNRNGIVRYIENVGRRLAERADVELTLVAPGSLAEALEYRAAVPWAGSCGIGHSWMQQHSASAFRTCTRLATWAPADRRLLPRALRRSFAIAAETLLRLQSSPKLPTSDAVVYHSPWEAIPTSVRQTRGVKIFLTMYDLLPLLHPEYFEPAVIETFNGILESITEETYFLCISESTKRDLCERLSIEPARAFVTKLAAGPEFYPCEDERCVAATRVKYKIPDGRYLLSLSTIEPRKNTATLIRAFLSAFADHPHYSDLSLVLVGGKGWLYEPLFAELARYGAAKERIIFTGFVDDADLSAIYTGAEGFVYVPFYEGFGLPPLEAMKCGVPCVVSNSSSLPEVAGDAGIYVNPHDLSDVAAGMRTLLSETVPREASRARALRQAARFSWENCAAETVAAYKTVLAR
jgi:glycosyltransferase involved in cell wall biosynthesis